MKCTYTLEFFFCCSHAESSDESVKLMSTGYLCPQCLSKHCELPVECRACGLTLVSAPHLARSYHYLFPVATFQEITFEGNHLSCFGCQKMFTQKDKKVVVLIICIHCCGIIQKRMLPMKKDYIYIYVIGYIDEIYF